MIEVKKEGILLEKTALLFENEGVLNPAVYREGDDVHLFYRAVSDGNYSSIGYCKLNGPATIVERSEFPVLSSEFQYEKHGLEDPRLVRINSLFYLTYTAYDGVNALGALATSSDLVTWKKHGVIVPQFTYDEFIKLAGQQEQLEEKYILYNEHIRSIELHGWKELVWVKNVIFFPRRIEGNLHFLHRIKPDIQIIVSIKDIAELTPEFWRKHLLQFNSSIVLTSRYEHERSYIGGGCPPIETKVGWLLIYHGVHNSKTGHIYSACAALLDLEKPTKEIARLPYPLFEPEKSWELIGEVNNVVFPTGAIVFNELLYIYYGAADERIAYATIKLEDLLEELLNNKI